MTKQNPGVSRSTPQRKGEQRPKEEKYRARVKKDGQEYFAGYAPTETAAAQKATKKRAQLVEKHVTHKRGRRSTSGTGTGEGTRSSR